ncbi:hypothetical protein HPB48_016696 [Haemaphysalis longicornis]|uniref:Uncharacterized protein n=1 Tax=Haemaphysalis longicornis TaxID=44386 RepID=A0A9J6GDX6_HAELO|nr:hypothetical protein HPB48_016696 [Haemaphysalis longicornis]
MVAGFGCVYGAQMARRAAQEAGVAVLWLPSSGRGVVRSSDVGRGPDASPPSHYGRQCRAFGAAATAALRDVLSWSGRIDGDFCDVEALGGRNVEPEAFDAER